jgi:serine/threonine protein kinase
LQSIDHPNIIKAHEVYTDEYTGSMSIVMELCRGKDLSSRRLYTEQHARQIIRQLVEAVNYLHSRGLMHGDINLENILFEDSSKEAAIKLVDFGK